MKLVLATLFVFAAGAAQAYSEGGTLTTRISMDNGNSVEGQSAAVGALGSRASSEASLVGMNGTCYLKTYKNLTKDGKGWGHMMAQVTQTVRGIESEVAATQTTVYFDGNKNYYSDLILNASGVTVYCELKK